MSSQSDLRKAKAFAAGYAPDPDDHPDLESRVVMFERALESGSTRAAAVHARTLMRFVGHLGMSAPKAGGGDDGPTKAELQELAESLGLSKSGSKAELQARIDEYDAGS